MSSFVMHDDTPSVLKEIVATRQQRLQEMAVLYPEAEIAAAAAASTRPVRDFTAALQQPNAQFILECKKASPSKGVIREDFDPVAIATIYASYAAAISVLTEPDYFQGDFAYLQAVSSKVHVPVLCKDFIFSTYQIDLARYFGADAILLMLSVLSDNDYQLLAQRAQQLGLHILTEVSNAEEMQRAAALNAKVIGINHRNLRDLSVDLNRSQELAALAPAGALLIAESGIENNQQIRSIAPHVDGFLVGGSLTEQADVDLACRKLIYGEHKICGLTHPAQAIAARAAGAAYGGLIFAKRSPRCVTLEQAQQICAVRGMNYVGVFALEDFLNNEGNEQQEAVYLAAAQQIAAIAATLQLTAIQLHDVQDVNFVAALSQALTMQERANYSHGHIEIWVARSVEASTQLYQQPMISREVWDHGRGGSGSSFDWQTLPSNEQRHRIQLAGGLKPNNIATAISLGCRGLDINSGVERQPGHKDPALMQQVFATIRIY